MKTTHGDDVRRDAMTNEDYAEVNQIIKACAGHEAAMEVNDQNFFRSLANKIAAYGQDANFSDEQVARFRLIYATYALPKAQAPR